MLINTDLPSDASARANRRNRADSGAIPQAAAGQLTDNSATNPLDPSLQLLAGTPSELQGVTGEIQDAQGAAQALAALTSGISQQPGLAFAAQGSQSSQNVLRLLQQTD